MNGDHGGRVLLMLIAPLLLLGCAGQATPAPQLPPISYPHIVVTIQPVELVLDRVAGRWQFAVRCREGGSFDEVTVVMREPRGEASYQSELPGTHTCPGDEPPALTGGLVIMGLQSDEQFTLTLTVRQRGADGIREVSAQRSYTLDARSELHPITP